MIYQILDLLIGIASAIVAGACLLLCYFDYFKINLGRAHGLMGSQIASNLLLITDWLTQPIRKFIQNTGPINLVYLFSGYLIILAKVIILSLVGGSGVAVVSLIIGALIQYIDLFLSILSAITFIYVILSWISQGSPSYFLAAQIIEPLLQPIRKIMPQLGALDLSPLALLIAIKVLQIVVSNLR